MANFPTNYTEKVTPANDDYTLVADSEDGFTIKKTKIGNIGGGGAVDSVNSQTGVVVLDADDIDDTSTTNKFVTSSDITKLSNLSGTNTGDQTNITGNAGTVTNGVYTTGDQTIGGIKTFSSFPVSPSSAPTTDYQLANKKYVDEKPQSIIIAISDETTNITTGTAKATFRMPYAFTLTAVRASLSTASSSGLPTFDINEGGVSILSTVITIDANEKTSTTAATPPVISDTALADDAEITIDIDVAGTGAKGAKIYLIGYKA